MWQSSIEQQLTESQLRCIALNLDIYTAAVEYNRSSQTKRTVCLCMQACLSYIDVCLQSTFVTSHARRSLARPLAHCGMQETSADEARACVLTRFLMQILRLHCDLHCLWRVEPTTVRYHVPVFSAHSPDVGKLTAVSARIVRTALYTEMFQNGAYRLHRPTVF